MPLDVLGRTRATLTEPASTSPWPKGPGNLVKLCRAGDRALQLLLFNEECLVSASHQLALITSSEALGLAQRGRQRPLRAGNLVKLGHLEEVKVVTRFLIPSGGDASEALAPWQQGVQRDFLKINNECTVC
jgi:hypothetical protein